MIQKWSWDYSKISAPYLGKNYLIELHKGSKYVNPFEEKISQLRAGEIDQFEVTREEFFLFREAWSKQEDKKFFRGIAGLKGTIIYVYDTTIV